MSAATDPMPPVPLTLEERLELANRLYREYHAQCFWYSPPDLEITEGLLPLVRKGLESRGGRRGFILAGYLEDRTRSE